MMPRMTTSSRLSSRPTPTMVASTDITTQIDVRQHHMADRQGQQRQRQHRLVVDGGGGRWRRFILD